MRIVTGNHCDPDASHQGLLSTLSQQTAFGLATLDNVGALIAEFGIDSTRQAIEEFGRRCRSFLREDDALIEFSESRFYYVLAELKDNNHLLLAALKLERLFEWPFEIGIISMPLDVHVGWVYCTSTEFSSEGTSPQLYKIAELARRAAISSGTRYDIQLTEQLSSLTTIPENNIAVLDDISTDDIIFDYQAKYRLRDGAILGTEALLSLRRDGSIIPQDEFVSLLSERALWQLTLHSVRCVIRSAIEISTETSVSLKIDHTSLNTNLVTLIQEELSMWDVPAPRLMVEITDLALVDDPGNEHQVLNSLHKLGVKICIAKFGSTCSPLQSIRDLPVDEIKLDGTFIHNIAENESNQYITQTLIDLCHRFSIFVVAEGIENSETLAWLIDAGCDAGQGLYLGESMSKDRSSEFVH